MDISPIDLINIQSFTTRIIALNEYRSKLSTYLGDKMNQCAPNLTALIGNQVRHLLFNVVLHTSVRFAITRLIYRLHAFMSQNHYFGAGAVTLL